MRKFIVLVLCAFLVLCLYACQDQPELNTPEQTEPIWQYIEGSVFKFPEGTVLCGVDLSGKLGVDAYRILKDAIENYTLELTVNGQKLRITAKDMSLQLDSDKMAAYIEALKNGEDTSELIPLTYNAKQLQSRIAYQINIPGENVSLTYDTQSRSFVFVDSVPGTAYDLEPVTQELESVICALGTEYTATAQGYSIDAAITAESEIALQAQANANKQLRTALTYCFTPDGSRTTYVALTIDEIADFLTVDEDLKTTVNTDAVKAYAERMGELYSVGDNDGKFLNSWGEYIDFKITYADQTVDTQALADDIIYCLENGISGARTAPYSAKGKGWTHDFGGSYVEIDLTHQRLWVYQDYECKLYTPVVTGNLSEEWNTPTGIFKVYQRIYPTRAGRVFRYWMPFLGAYGLHDANWRSEFRSDEYLFEGSHGCVNIPPENFVTVYNTVSVGTPVIIYGGADLEAPVTQVLSGPDTYDVGVDAGKFKLDVTPKYGESRYLTYTSDNPDVVKVYSSGLVKVRKTGTAHITVESYDWNFCASVKKVITINVHEDCSEVGHMIVNWEQIKAPTCQTTGVEKGVCTSCDYYETRYIPTCHDFDFAAYMHDQSWIVTKWPTCTEAGEKYRTCQDCGYTETAEVPAEGHIYCNWSVTEATETQDGKKIGTCYFCDKVCEEVIPAGT